MATLVFLSVYHDSMIKKFTTAKIVQQQDQNMAVSSRLVLPGSRSGGARLFKVLQFWGIKQSLDSPDLPEPPAPPGPHLWLLQPKRAAAPLFSQVGPGAESDAGNFSSVQNSKSGL